MTWLIIDVSYICHRNFHALKNMPAADIGTEVIFGFLHDVVRFQNRHGADNVVFCFDYGEPLRKQIFPKYKISREKRHRKEPRDDRKRRGRLDRQMHRLRKRYLKEIGYQNILYQKGYEADDIIASVALNIEDEAIIVSADHDFFQLLRPNVMIWNPNAQHMTTHESFRKEFGLEPEQWAMVKALAGCKTDDVPGIEGIGEKTAAKFVAGFLDHEYKAYKTIMKKLAIWKRNMPLVKLPYQGVNKFKLHKDKVTQKSWRAFARRKHMRSLLSVFPRGQ